MKNGKIITDDNEIKEILQNAKNIAIVGLSPKFQRDSHIVARYLKESGYKIIPVRPAQKEILGEKAYAGLEQIPEKVDIVDVFRRSDQIEPYAKEAILIKPRVFWMQLNIENQQVAELLTQSGIDVIMNRCIKIEHERLCKQNKL